MFLGGYFVSIDSTVQDNASSVDSGKQKHGFDDSRCDYNDTSLQEGQCCKVITFRMKILSAFRIPISLLMDKGRFLHFFFLQVQTLHIKVGLQHDIYEISPWA